MLIKNLIHPRLKIETCNCRKGESWCFYGDNRSGINEFLSLLERELEPAATDILLLPDTPAIISCKLQQQIFEEEIRKDDSDFLDKIDPGTPARSFLPRTSLDHPLITTLSMQQCLDTGYRQLSSGQSKKLLLLRAILSGAGTIVIDSPYDGIDHQSCVVLNQALAQLTRTSVQLFILVRNVEDIPRWCSHLALFCQREMICQGRMAEVMLKIPSLTQKTANLFQADAYPIPPIIHPPATPKELIRLRNGFACYGNTNIFSGLDLTICRGEHSLITGPNGCGKSTLLHILSGDNPKCYANDLHIFGQKRGSGESIWEIKQHMGIVSPEIHRCHRVPGTALHVVLSGLFDSIGLYRNVATGERKMAEQWLAVVGLAHHAATPFRHLQYGDQRLVLIARALIKQPALLLLDEPTQGLDGTARTSLLNFLEAISHTDCSTIVYVSHREDEYRSFFHQHIHLETFKQH